MNLSELTDLMNHLVADKGWYRPDSRAPQTPRNIAASLSIEAAEVLEHFQWTEAPRHPEELPGELADVALYCCNWPTSAALTWSRPFWTSWR
jgi:NTP pyrophosphatase (non-canonical NTP hydrolase)